MNRVLFAVGLLLSACALAESAAAGKLTLKQVLALVKVAPDQLAASEIRQRGVSDPIARGDLTQVQEAGGGPRTLEALRRLIVPPVLIVASNQEQSEVLLDGVSKGTAGPARPLTIRDSDAGAHSVTVRKARYSTAELPVVLTGGKTSELAAQLSLSVALLSIATNAPNATIAIDGLDLAGRRASNIELPPGTYTVHVDAPRFNGVTREVTVKAGDTIQVQIPLTIDPSFTRSLLTQAQNEEAAGHYPAAFKLASHVLSFEPASGPALAVEAMSAFYAGQYPMFTQIGLRAVRSGAELDIPVLHHHALSPAHLATLKVQGSTLAYDAGGQPGANCNVPSFIVSMAALQSVEVKADNRGLRYLELKVSGPALRKTEKLDCLDYRCRVQARGNGLLTISAPPAAAAEIEATAELLQSIWRGSRP